MAGWQDAPIVGNGQQQNSGWQSAPVVQNAPPQEGYDQSYFAQGTSGVNEGIANVLGFPVDATNAVLRAGAAGVNKVLGTDIQLPTDAFGGSQTFKTMMGGAIKPETADAGKQFVRRIGQEVGSAIVPGLGVVARAEKPIAAIAGQVAPAVGSGVGAATANQIAPDNPYAELAGQIFGGFSSAGALKGIQKAVTPFAMTPQQQVAATALRNEGVDLTAGQMTGSRTLKNMESELGGGTAERFTEQQAEQFTNAALSRAGISANRATPEVMDNAFTTIGQQFDQLASRNRLVPDQNFGQDVGQVVRDYNSLVPQSQRAPAINNILTDVVRSIQSQGYLSGESYQALRSRLDKLARASLRSDPNLSDAFFGIRNALDSAMERSLQAYNPDDLGAWQQVRSDYRNLLAIEDAVSKAGENATNGLITPANLKAAVSKQGKRAYVRGQNDLGNLARNGVQMMTPLPNSGTAGRLSARNIGTSLTSVLGAGVGGGAGGIPGAITGATIGSAVPYGLGRLMLSNPGRAYLSNQAWTGPLGLQQGAAGPSLSALSNLINGDGQQQPLSLSQLRALSAT